MLQADFADKIWRGEADINRSIASMRGNVLTINQMKDVLVRLYDESNAQNFSVFDELFAPDFVSYGGAGFQDLHGAKAFRELYEQFLRSMPDLYFRVEQMVAEGDMCGVRGTLSGSHKGNFMGFAPPTDKRITWTGTAIFRFNSDGLMDARWQEWDGLSVMQQMGVIPAPPAGAEPPVLIPPHVLGGELSSPSENKETVRRFIQEFWNEGRNELADQIFHPQAVNHGNPFMRQGPEFYRVVAGMIRGGFSGFQIRIQDLLADGDQVLVKFQSSGTHSGEMMGFPATGRKLEWGGIDIYRFAGGQVVEVWANEDFLGLTQKMSGTGGPSSGA